MLLIVKWKILIIGCSSCLVSHGGWRIPIIVWPTLLVIKILYPANLYPLLTVVIYVQYFPITITLIVKISHQGFVFLYDVS